MLNGTRVQQSLTAVAVLVAAIGVCYNACNMGVARDAFELQRKSANRTWAAGLLNTLYSDAKLPVREEALRAYLALQHELKERPRLREVDLSGMNLADYDFRDADLTAASVLDTILDGADFTKAELETAVMRPKSCAATKFHETNLRGAICFDGVFDGADFLRAKLQGTKFSEVDLGSGRSYRPASLRGAKFKGAEFDENTWICAVDASGADLSRAVHLAQRHVTCSTPLVTDVATRFPERVQPAVQ